MPSESHSLSANYAFRTFSPFMEGCTPSKTI